MIVVDSSALIAILQGEPEARSLLDRMVSAERLAIGAPTKFEALMVATRKPNGPADIEDLLNHTGCETSDWTEALVSEAHRAFVLFGKGRHPAKLNFGDCMAYALAKSLDAPLLYKGEDFAKTDIKAAL